MADTAKLIKSSTYGKLNVERYKLGFYRSDSRSHLMWLICMDCNKTVFERADGSGALSLGALLDSASRHDASDHPDEK